MEMDAMTVIPAVVIAIVALIVGAIAYHVIKNLSQPVLRRETFVVAKRAAVSGGSGDSSTSTVYYCTFESENGERKEFNVSGNEFGLLVEGDRGVLSSQGDWYKGFERQRV